MNDTFTSLPQSCRGINLTGERLLSIFGEIRTLEIDGEVWFVGKDIALALGYSDTVNALKTHIDGEDKKGWRIATASRGEQEAIVISESGLYSLIFGSKLETAKKFKHWITSEVLPTIRKTGQYSVKQAEPRLTSEKIQYK